MSQKTFGKMSQMFMVYILYTVERPLKYRAVIGQNKFTLQMSTDARLAQGSTVKVYKATF